MKILMFAPNFYPHIGGVEKHIMKVSGELIKKGHEVIVITIKESNTLLDLEEIEKIKIYRIPNKTILKIWAWLSQNKYLIKESDIIHCHDYIPFLWYFPFRLLFRSKPAFITFHGFEGRIPIQYRVKILRKISELFTNGNISIGHYIQKWYRTKPTFISYGGVDSPQNFNGTEKLNENEAIFIGRLEKDTGIMQYLQALQILRDNYRISIKLNICGDGSLHSDVEDFIKSNHLKADMHGFVTDITPFLMKSKFAFVSGYLAILEALIYKKNVFAIYDNEIKKDYLTMMTESEKIITVAASSDELAYSIYRNIENPSESANKIKMGYDYALRNTWKNVSNIYLTLWKEAY